MNESDGKEKGQLLVLALLMMLPSIFWLGILSIYKVFHLTMSSPMDWTRLPGLFVNLAMFVLPFLWKGKLNGVAVLRRTFQSFDLTSVFVALVPLVIWIGALYTLTASSNQPFQLHAPFVGLTESPFWLQALANSLIGGGAHIFAMLVIASATKSSERAVTMVAITVFGIFVSLANYATIYWGNDLRGVPVSVYSPMPSILREIGTLACVLALVTRGKFGGLSVAVFLLSTWLLPWMGNPRNSGAISIGLLGGSLVILLVNYLQQSGKWVRWSAENQT